MGKTERNRPLLLVALGLMLATLLAFEPLRHNDFVLWDDDVYLTENPHVRDGLSAESVRWAFTTHRLNNWHPLTWLSYLLDIELYGLSPMGVHATNLLLHLLNTLLLLTVLERMTRRLWPSAFVAALFALHPVHVEAVAWASERKELLSTCLGLLSLWAYIGFARRGGHARYLLMASLFALGLMAKPMLVTLPFLFLLLDYWPLERVRLPTWGWGPEREPAQSSATEGPDSAERSLGQLVIEKLPLLALSGVSSLVTVWVQRGGLASTDTVAFGQRAANALVAYVRYLGHMLWPSGLSPLYPHPNLPGGIPWSVWELAGAAGLMIAISILVLRVRRQRYALVGWLWYLGTLVPVIGLVQVGAQAMADRYTYLSLIGPFIVIAWAGADWLSHRPAQGGWLRKVLVSGAGLMLLACIPLTRSQVGHWRDTQTLFGHALQVHSRGEGSAVHNNLGVALHTEGRYEEAIHHYRQAVRIRPGNAKYRNNLANALRHLDRDDEALGHYRVALQVKPDYPDTYNNLGALYASRNELPRAILNYHQALQLEPDYADAHNNLAEALRKQDKLDEATQHYRAALRSEPDHAGAQKGLGHVLLSGGLPEQALEVYQEALRMQPDDPETLSNLALVLQSLGKLEEAIGYYRRTLQLDPDHGTTLYNLAIIRGAQGRLVDAAGHYRHVLRVQPDHAKAHANLGAVLVSLGEPTKAIGQFREALVDDPNYAEAHYNLGIVLALRGQPEAAIEHYRQTLRLAPRSADAHNNLGAVLASLGRTQEAIQQYRQTLHLDPDHVDAHFNLAVLLGSRGQISEEIQHYRATLRIDPRNTDAHFNLGLVLASRGELQEAIEQYRQTLQLSPEHAGAQSQLTAALEALGPGAEIP